MAIGFRPKPGRLCPGQWGNTSAIMAAMEKMGFPLRMELQCPVRKFHLSALNSPLSTFK